MSDIENWYCILVVGVGLAWGVWRPLVAFDHFIGFSMSYSLLDVVMVQIRLRYYIYWRLQESYQLNGLIWVQKIRLGMLILTISNFRNDFRTIWDGGCRNPLSCAFWDVCQLIILFPMASIPWGSKGTGSGRVSHCWLSLNEMLWYNNFKSNQCWVVKSQCRHTVDQGYSTLTVRGPDPAVFCSDN